MQTLLHDLRFAIRQLRKSPGFAAVAIITLALGIGANTAIFSLLNTVLLKTLPVPHPGQLFFLDNGGARGPNGGPPYPCFQRFRDQTNAFSGMAALDGGDFDFKIDGHVERLRGIEASGSYFDVLGIKPILGRLMVPGDERLDPPVAVLSYAYWQRRFHGDPKIIGKVIQLDTHALTVIGVTPPGFFGLQVGESVDVTFPITIDHAGLLNSKGAWWLDVIGRLKPGFSQEQARVKLDVIFQNFMSEGKMPAEYRRDYFDHMELLPASRGAGNLREMFSKPLLVLMTLVGLVLLICCANISNLLLARTAARQRELAVRIAIGADCWRLVRQLLTETLLLFFLGASLALAFASLANSAITGYLASASQVHLDVRLESSVLGYTACITLVTAVLFGLAPALGATRINPRVAMQGTDEGTVLRHSKWGARRILIVSQVSLSLIALVGAGLFIRTLHNLRSLDPGFRPSGVLLMTLEPLGSAHTPARRSAFWEETLEQTRAIRGVRSASLSVLTPLTKGDRGSEVDIPGFQPLSEAAKEIHVNHVSDGYFETMGIPVLLGRTLSSRDNATAPKVAVINDAAAKFYFGDRDPLGTQINLGKSLVSDGLYEIVGVVKDSKQHDLRDAAPRFVFIPVVQPEDDPDHLLQLTLAVKTGGNPTVLAPQIRQLIQNLGSDTVITDVITLNQQLERSLLRERLVSTLASFFGILAMLVASIGLYGLMSYSVLRRTKEVGIRIALGSQTSSVCWLILREALLTVGIGTVVGIPGALLLTRAVQSLEYGIPPYDPTTIIGCAVILAAVAALGAYLPARRAAKVDPMVALRYE